MLMSYNQQLSMYSMRLLTNKATPSYNQPDHITDTGGVCMKGSIILRSDVKVTPT